MTAPYIRSLSGRSPYRRATEPKGKISRLMPPPGIHGTPRGVLPASASRIRGKGATGRLKPAEAQHHDMPRPRAAPTMCPTAASSGEESFSLPDRSEVAGGQNLRGHYGGRGFPFCHFQFAVRLGALQDLAGRG